MTKFTHSYYQKVIHLRSKVYIKHTTIHIHGDNLYLDMCIYIFLQSLSLAARGELLGHKIVHQFGFSFKCIADLLKTLNLLAHIKLQLSRKTAGPIFWALNSSSSHLQTQLVVIVAKWLVLFQSHACQAQVFDQHLGSPSLPQGSFACADIFSSACFHCVVIPHSCCASLFSV